MGHTMWEKLGMKREPERNETTWKMSAPAGWAMKMEREQGSRTVERMFPRNTIYSPITEKGGCGCNSEGTILLLVLAEA